MTPKLTMLLIQINSIPDPQTRRALTELLQINDEMEDKINNLVRKVRDLDSRTVGMAK